MNYDNVNRKHISKDKTMYKKISKGWNEENTKRCEIISEKSAAYIFMLGMTIKYYEKHQSRWEIIIIICTYILGAGGIPSLVITDNIETVRVVNGIVQGFIIILGLAKTIYQWINYKEKIKEFSWSYHKYTDLYVKIETIINSDVNK